MTEGHKMKSTLSAVILSAALANSVTAGPIMPEGQIGLTQETMIGRSLAKPDLLLRVGDDRFLHLYPSPKPIPRSIVVPRYYDSLALPAACRAEYFTADLGWANYLGARCLEENYRAARDLPQHCAMTISTEDRLRDVYDEYCLRQAGYTVSGW
jgi:hypothetical protein